MPGTIAPMPGTIAPMPGTIAPMPGTIAPMPGTIAPIPGTIDNFGPHAATLGDLRTTMLALYYKLRGFWLYRSRYHSRIDSFQHSLHLADGQKECQKLRRLRAKIWGGDRRGWFRHDHR